MYFNEKEDTNIDKEFKTKVDLNKYKKIIIIGVIALILIILLIIIIFAVKNRTVYYMELNGSSEITIYQGVNYSDNGVRAYDNHNNDLSNLVKINNNVDSTTIGRYTVTYTLKDRVITRTVNVVEPPKDPISFHLNGNSEIILKVGDKYEELGVIATDYIEGSLNYTVKGKVDTSKAGTYIIEYVAKNSRGNTSSTKRVVIVK